MMIAHPPVSAVPHKLKNNQQARTGNAIEH